MKKKLLLISVLSIITALLCSCILVACEKNINKLDLIKSKISYIENEHLRFDSEEYSVSVIRGEKEQNYIADGKCVGVAPFTTISVEPFNTDLIGKQYSFRLIGDKGEASGSLIKNILGVTYTAAIDSEIELGNIVKAEITIGEDKKEITFVNALDNKISSLKAIEYAYNELEASLDNSFTKDEFKREVYVRYINDLHDRTSPYYWYVSFMNDNSDYLSILIDPDTGSPIK